MADEQTYTFRCPVLGYGGTVKTPGLPGDFEGPGGGVGPEMFELVRD